MPYIFTVKSVSLLKTIERIESIAVASWVVVDFSVISFYIYISVKIIKSIFSLSDEKLLLGPVTLISYVFSHYLASNRFELENFSKYISVWANIILGFVIPFIVLVVGKIRKKV